MVKQGKSMISDGGKAASGGVVEASDSNSSIVLQNPAKRARTGSAKVASNRFKGVVPQLNGNFGAQIYANHQRIWLGTFKSEEDAAMAYDSAAIKLRSGDSHRNFPWTAESVEEPKFQNIFSQEAVLSMIKDGSYRSKFMNYLRLRAERVESRVGQVPNPLALQAEGGLAVGGGFLCRQLFQKELTPSDVGKLNRLVIPKKYAVKYFRRLNGSNKPGGPLEDVQLVFYDGIMRTWKFRYCYWTSSQSFVFTRGWRRYVNEKKLKAGDTVSFYICEPIEPADECRKFCMIDVARGQGEPEQLIGAVIREDDGAENNDEPKGVAKFDLATGDVADVEAVDAGNSAKGFKLFGVQIN